MAFREKYENEYAERTYLRGRELLKNNKCFRNDLANVYMLERKYEEMIGEYLDMLDDNEMNLANVESRLQSVMFMDIDDNLQRIIKTDILKRIQTRPDYTPYNELLIWLYIQEKEFDKAFIQTRAIDKRNNEDGDRVMSLARLSASNEFYSEALEMYRYVINKGSSSNNYFNARRELLGTQFNHLLSGPDAPLDSIALLEINYEKAFAEFGKNAQTVSMIREMAHIKAFYLNKPEDAIAMLEDVIKVQGVNSFTLADCKLELADIDLLAGNIWEAALVYGQVEKANENNPTGHEAKFRKARLAYFTGDFKWAQAQLDVLKASTSKLIANDACELSLLISDNSDMDTSEAALRMFARADLLSYQNKDSLAILTLDSLLKMFPAHSLTDEAYFKKAGIFYKLRKYEDARECYQIIYEHYGFDILGDDALYRLARMYENNFHDLQKAMELYKEFLTTYPGSIYVIEVRKFYRKLRGDVI
jgi:tetratricopeptide (TPR) repeat protein